MIVVEEGEPVSTVRAYIGTRGDIAALVLGAAANGPPGPLVGHFAGTDAGALRVPVMIIPGALSREDIDRVS
jgi:hypothetical protein